MGAAKDNRAAGKGSFKRPFNHKSKVHKSNKKQKTLFLLQTNKQKKFKQQPQVRLQSTPSTVTPLVTPLVPPQPGCPPVSSGAQHSPNWAQLKAILNSNKKNNNQKKLSKPNNNNNNNNNKSTHKASKLSPSEATTVKRPPVPKQQTQHPKKKKRKNNIKTNTEKDKRCNSKQDEANQQGKNGEGVDVTGDAASDGETTVKRRVVGVDCEMVGVGYNGARSALARVSLVAQDGSVLLDRYVKPKQKVTKYRTRWSGITKQHLKNGEEFAKVMKDVKALLDGAIVVGHDLKNDFGVMRLDLDQYHIRDTAKYPPFVNVSGSHDAPSLKSLALAVLGVTIHTGQHCSVQDARVAMQLYVSYEAEWEAWVHQADADPPPVPSDIDRLLHKMKQA